MKIKPILNSLIVAMAIVFMACDDDLNSVGNNIQPDSDGISLNADTINFTATTYSFNDSIYALTTRGVVGEYTDPVLGKVKSDYLCEFYSDYPKEKAAFDNRIFAVDSVQVNILFTNYSGASDALMGITAYVVDKKDLDGKDLYTNMDPDEYCSKNEVYAKGVFSVKNISNYIVSLDADTMKGWDLYNAWKNDYLKDSKTFRENVLRGLYVTSTFGSGTLLEAYTTTLDVYYRINAGKKVHENKDSIVSRMFRVNVTKEVVQLNHVKNTMDIPALEAQRDTRTFMKSPAGVCTQINIPIKDIMNRMEKNKMRNINSASFKLLGFTEDEVQLGDIRKPDYLLFIHKDEANDYFRNGDVVDYKKSAIIKRYSGNNTYISYGGENIASTLSYYIDKYKKEGIPDDTLRYLLIPVSAELVYNSSTYSYVPTGKASHMMYPSAAILRTDPKNMKVPLIFSKYNNQE